MCYNSDSKMKPREGIHPMALLHVDFFSDVLGMCTNMDVILPETTVGQIGMEGHGSNGKCPTLYLLHGMSDDHTIWQRRTSIERYASEYNLAVVMPTTHLGWYTDMDMGYDYWTFISKALPESCRRFFPQMSARREDTFAAGLSMGGYGAMKCGLLAPETFSCCASLSGELDIADTCEHGGLNEYSGYWRDIFGALDQVRGMCDLLYPAGLNIDYFPTNFVPSAGTLYYVDYECNAYEEQWDFEHWGIRYWSKTDEFCKYTAQLPFDDAQSVQVEPSKETTALQKEDHAPC